MSIVSEQQNSSPAGDAPRAPRASATTVDPQRKSPFLAGFLSAVMPGLGQVYIGYYQRGFVHAIVVAVIITLLASNALEALIPLGAIFLGFFYLYNVVDGARRAALYNHALAGGGEIELPEDFQALGVQGSIAGGVVLVALGVLLLANTAFGMSLAWLEEWWPAALIGFGAYLVWKARQERSGGPEGGADELGGYEG